MAKEGVKARELKRAKLVAKYAEKRAALKEAGDYVALDKLPKAASPVKLHNRCKLTGRPARVHAPVRHFACYIPRYGPGRQNTGNKESELVVFSSKYII